jgi:hypothetical protein
MAEDYQTKLIDIASNLAKLAPTQINEPGADALYLRRFRAAYRFLASTVETSNHETRGTITGSLLLETDEDVKPFFDTQG